MKLQTIFIGLVHIVIITGVLMLFQWMLWKMILKKGKGRSFTVTMYLLTILSAILVLVPVEAVAYLLFIAFKNYILAKGAVPYEAGGPDVYFLVAVLIAGIWIVGAIVLLIRRRLITMHLWHGTRSGEPLPEHLQKIFEDECERMGLAGKATVQSNVYVNSAQVIHWKKNNVVQLPVVEDISELDFRTVLRHELYHVKHRDYAWCGFANFLSAFTWFNPAAWNFVHDLDFWMDVCRDAEVVESGITDVNGYYVCLARYFKAHDRMLSVISTRFSATKKKNLLLERRNLLLRMMDSKSIGRFSLVVMTALLVIGTAISTFAGGYLVHYGYVRLYEVVVDEIEHDPMEKETGEYVEVLSEEEIESINMDVMSDSNMVSCHLEKGVMYGILELDVKAGEEIYIQGVIEH